jgi:MFS family permease
MAIGALEVAVPAFAAGHGHAPAAGLLLAAWSIGSAIGGVLYGAGDWALPLPQRWVALSVLLAAGLAPVVAAWSIPTMLALLVLAGLGIAPTIASGSQLLGVLAPPGMGTEAYAWGPTALVVGASLGNAAGGALAQASDWRAGALCAIGMGAVGAAIAVGRRRRLSSAYRASLAAATSGAR